jgi:hypothetical protein
MQALLTQVIAYILAGDIDHSAVASIAHDVSGGGHSDTKGVVAALHFMLSSGAKYDVDDRTLLLEIQQLGLPKESADAIARAYSDEKDAMRARFGELAYSINKLKRVDWRVDQVLATGGEGTKKGSGGGSSSSSSGEGADSSSSSSSSSSSPGSGDGEEPLGKGAEVHLKFTIDTAPHTETSPGVSKGAAVDELACAMTKEKFQVLHYELRQAREQMKLLEG